jgi:hypothetical protein
MWDHFHILENIWPKKLGPFHFNELRHLLKKLLQAKTKEIFEETLCAILTNLVAKPDLVSYMQGWADDRQYYATYLLDNHIGSLGRRGSSPSEQNHSSYVATIGSGFMDDPCVMLQKTVVRQMEVNKKRNERISIYLSKSAVEKHIALTEGDLVLAEALEHLSSWGMELWNKRFKEASNYHCNIADDGFSHSVQRTDSTAPPRLIAPNDRCNCSDRIAFLFPCSHEMCAGNYKFLPEQFEERWLKRSSIGGSTNLSRFDKRDSAPEQDENDFSDFDDGHEGTNLEPMNSELPGAFGEASNQQSQLTTATGRNSGYTFIMSICQSFAQACSGHRLENVCCGIILQMTNVLQGTKAADVGEANNWDSMVTKFSAVVNTYRNAFSGMRGNTSSSSTAVPVDFTQGPSEPNPQVGRPESKRKKPLVETLKNKSNKKAKMVDQKCGFCGSPEHGRQTVCPLMHSLGQKITDKKEFLNFLFSRAPFSPWQGAGTLLQSMPQRARHIVVNKMYSTSTLPEEGQGRPQFAHTVYEATVLGDQGLPMPSYDKVHFEAQAVVEFISKMGKSKTKHHVFSKLASA